MMYDFPTLFSVTVFVSAVAGLLLLFAWMQNRDIVSLGMWGSAFLMNAVAMNMLVEHVDFRGGHILTGAWSICLGNALWLAAHGIMWTAARAFEGRRTPFAATLAGALIWLIACQFDGFYASLQARIMLASAFVGGYLMLCAIEIWRGRDPELVSRWPAIVLLVIHATVFLMRVPLAGVLPFPGGIQPPALHWLPIGAFEILFHIFCMSVLLVNMAKERAELQQRHASLVDPLTGVANRRAFFDRGETLLRRMQAERRTASLLLFDLDRFKIINDTYGHLAGDQVLLEFCRLTQSMLRPNDLFGRYGGEEFACLLPDASLAEAATIAERIRSALAGAQFVTGMPKPVTVSVGVAVASESDNGLTPLFTAADRALYRAKAKGRNRVEPARAPLLLVEPASLASA